MDCSPVGTMPAPVSYTHLPIADLARVVEAAINAGATTINIPDTVGYTMPFEFAGIISGLYERVPNIDKAIISVHTHDDLGPVSYTHLMVQTI